MATRRPLDYRAGQPVPEPKGRKITLYHNNNGPATEIGQVEIIGRRVLDFNHLLQPNEEREILRQIKTGADHGSAGRIGWVTTDWLVEV